MHRDGVVTIRWALAALFALTISACRETPQTSPSELPDLNEQTRVYVTREKTRVRTGPGPQFRAIAEIPRDAKVNVVGRDGDWVLIVSKKGNAPGYVEIASVESWTGDTKEELDPRAEGRYETVSETEVRSGPGLHYPVVASIAKGTKINVVDEEKGWLKVESKRGNKPGYVEARLAKPTVGE